jgi:uncharacterized protein YjbI with pentapeptide repeats
MSKINTNIEISTVKITLDEVKEYVDLLHNDKKYQGKSLNDYLIYKNKHASNHIIIADLSDIEFNGLNLEKADFSGTILNNSKFIKCNLKGAIFCDTDLNNTFFQESNLRDLDLRGCDLSTCQFHDSYRDYGIYKKSDDLSGIKYSVTAPQGRIYANIKSSIHHKLDLPVLITKQENKVNELYNQLPYGWQFRAESEGMRIYKEELQKLEALKRGKIPQQDRVINNSLGNIFSSNNSKFDPAYVRGSNREQEFQYIKLSRDDLEKYLEKIKEEGKNDLSINDFAKSKLSLDKLQENVRYVADFSASGNLDNSLNRQNLARLDFTGANLAGANFSGADLTEAVFDEADISGTTFEGALLSNSSFNDTKAYDANFANSDVSNAIFNGAKCQRAFMPRVNGVGLGINNSNFEHANIRNGDLERAQITNSNFTGADLQNISFAHAKIQETKMQHAILNDAIMTECEIIKSDFQSAFMQNVDAQKTKWQNTTLDYINGENINLTDAELDNLCTLNEADLENAIMNRTKALGVSFLNSNLDNIKAENANFTGANLENATMRFAQVSNTILDDAIANNVDMRGASFIDVKARGAEFRGAILQGVDARGLDITDGILEEADLRNSTFRKCIFDQVKIHKAKVNANTAFLKTSIEGAVGELNNYDEHDKKTGTITIEEQKKLSEEINRGKNLTKGQKLFGKVLGLFASGGNKLKAVAQTISSSISNNFKYFAIAIGVVAGLAITGPISIVIGTSYLVSAGISTILCGTCAFFGSKYIKKLGVGSVVGGIAAATITASPVGIIAGAAIGEGVNKVLEKTTGVAMNAATVIGPVVAVAATGIGFVPIVLGVAAGYTTDFAVKRVTGESTATHIKDLSNKAIEKCANGAELYQVNQELGQKIEEAGICQKRSDEQLVTLKHEIELESKAQDISTKQKIATQRVMQHRHIPTVKLDATVKKEIKSVKILPGQIEISINNNSEEKISMVAALNEERKSQKLHNASIAG